MIQGSSYIAMKPKAILAMDVIPVALPGVCGLRMMVDFMAVQQGNVERRAFVPQKGKTCEAGLHQGTAHKTIRMVHVHTYNISMRVERADNGNNCVTCGKRLQKLMLLPRHVTVRRGS